MVPKNGSTPYLLEIVGFTALSVSRIVNQTMGMGEIGFYRCSLDTNPNVLMTWFSIR
jgi:hypothetical protein